MDRRAPFFDGYESLFSGIRSEWDAAEGTIKLAEQIDNAVILPSVNELRYAGRRLVDALNAAAAGKPETDVLAFLADARFNCHRARHDAIDAATTKMALDFEAMLKRLGYNAVLGGVPDFWKTQQALAAVRGCITKSRENRERREQIYATIEAVDFPDLVRGYQNVMHSEPVAKRMAARQRIGYALSLVIGLAGALAGIIALI